MISFRGLTIHIIMSWCTYFRSCLNYLEIVSHEAQEDVSWEDIGPFILWIQQQLSFYKLNSFLTFAPSKDDVYTFIFTVSDLKQKAMIALMYSTEPFLIYQEVFY